MTPIIRNSLLLTVVAIVSGILIFMFVRKAGDRSNRHMWALPNGDEIAYSEVAPETPGFTASITQKVAWTGKNGGVSSFDVGVGGSYNSIELWVGQNQKIAWITGRDSGQDKRMYLALLDIVNRKAVGAESMWLPKDQVSSIEYGLKQSVEAALVGATQIPEKK